MIVMHPSGKKIIFRSSCFILYMQIFFDFFNFLVTICFCFEVLAAVDGVWLLTAMHWRVFHVL